MAEAPPRRLARTPSSSGVWWKLGDPAESSSEVERRLRGIAEKEAAVRARMERRAAGAPAVRRKIAVTSLSLEVVALVYGLWTATRRGMGWRNRGLKLLLLLLLPALAIPALVLPAFARFRNMLDARDQQKLERLRAERKAKIGHFRGSLHNLQKLIEKYDPDAAAADSDNEAAASKKLKRTHSRLNFHVGDD
ncbi:uncharacterized protein At2g24330-like [Phragmites australis]|uniref:uncharacterized protein At2g24330-like n=1 Tax=Phragmites australis TaxID=29695 RepID=UPI002D791E62|nr:uncharacterized protein At2g24330-like [Phragmites australis]